MLSLLFVFLSFLFWSNKYRLGDYIEIVQTSGGSLEEITSLGESIVTAVTDILNENPSDAVADAIYALLEQLESAISCGLECGEEAVLVQVFYFLSLSFLFLFLFFFFFFCLWTSWLFYLFLFLS